MCMQKASDDRNPGILFSFVLKISVILTSFPLNLNWYSPPVRRNIRDKCFTFHFSLSAEVYKGFLNGYKLKSFKRKIILLAHSYLA